MRFSPLLFLSVALLAGCPDTGVDCTEEAAGSVNLTVVDVHDEPIDGASR
jgi:hypothetical protein